jgi:hypothetical protein
MKRVPPEKWPQWRAEQKRKDECRGGLIGWIERCLDDGVIVFTKQAVREFAKGDLDIAYFCLMEWEAAGILEILKPLDEASDQENVIKMKKFIARTTDSYPGNWPFEKRSSSN